MPNGRSSLRKKSTAWRTRVENFITIPDLLGLISHRFLILVLLHE
jgi:hypothetical protein